MIVGLTGGIGSGKSTVARIFEALKIPVYVADEASKNLLDTDRALQRKLISLLGQQIIENNKLNRAAMAAIIFNDKDLLQKTNALIHPAVAEDFKKWYKQQSAPYVIREAAILYESGTYKDCDAVISVSAPEKMRIERVMTRNSISAEEVRLRMQNQWPQEQKDARADYIIKNDNSESVIEQVIHIHENLLRSSKQRIR